MKLPTLPFVSRPKSLPERLKADAERAGSETVRFARSIPSRLESSRKNALAVAGAATGAAAGFAFWRSRHEDTPPVHQDPARPSAPWKMPPPDDAAEPSSATSAATKPVAGTKAAAANAAGSRSK